MRIIDRIEGDTAVVEITDEFADMKISELPKDAKEGDVLVLVDGVYAVDKEATRKRKAAIRARLRRLKKKAKKQNGK